MYYQNKQPGIAIIWAEENDVYNIHNGKHPIGIQIFGKDYIHALGVEASREERCILLFGGSENIKEEWRGKLLVLTPDLQSYQIISVIDDAFGSWGEILKNRNIIVIS